MTGGAEDHTAAGITPPSVGEGRAKLLRAYTDAIITAQASHSPWDWIVAGSAFKQYAEAAVAAATSMMER